LGPNTLPLYLIHSPVWIFQSTASQALFKQLFTQSVKELVVSVPTFPDGLPPNPLQVMFMNALTPGMPISKGVLPALQLLILVVVPGTKMVEVAMETEVAIDVLVEAGRVMVEVTKVPGGVTVMLVVLSGS
jgi:hypothetical protein